MKKSDLLLIGVIAIIFYLYTKNKAIPPTATDRLNNVAAHSPSKSIAGEERPGRGSMESRKAARAILYPNEYNWPNNPRGIMYPGYAYKM